MNKKYASFIHLGSYACRMSPFFNCIKEVESWERAYDVACHIGHYYIRSVTNWQEVIDNRSSCNCDDIVPVGE